MAITGRFLADFSDFERAVQSAEVELRGLETGSVRVANSLSRMVDQFSGRKLIQDATLMAEAVERIGGAGKLTEAELERVSAKASEAAEKMRALGMQVPDGIDRLAKSTKDATTAGGAMTSQFGALASQLAGMFTITAVIGFTKSVIDAGDAIQKAADQTGMMTGEVQKLQYIAGQSGVSFDAMVRATQTIQERLGDNNSGTIGALKEMGVSLEEFRAASHYDRLILISDGLKSIEDADRRAALAQDVLGKSAREVFPALISDMRKVGEEAPKMSDAAVKGLDEFGDGLGRAYTQAKTWAGETLNAIFTVNKAWSEFVKPATDQTSIANSFAQFMNLIDGGAKDLKATLDTTKPAVANYGGALNAAALSGADLAQVQKDLDEQNKRSIEANKAAAEEAKKRAAADKEAARELAEWQAVFDEIDAAGLTWQDTLAGIDEQLTAHIQTLIEAGISQDKLAKAYGLTTTQVHAMARALDEADDAQKRAAKQASELEKLTEELFETRASRSRTSTEQEIADINRWAATYKQKLEESGILTQQMADTIDAIAKERGGNALIDWDLVEANSQRSLQEIADRARATYEYMVANAGEFSTNTILEFEATARAAQDAADQWSTSFEIAGQEVAQSAGRAAGHVAAAAQQAALSWSQAMDLVREGKGTMSGSVQTGGMTNYGPWGSPAHAAAVQRAYDAGRYFGPVVTRAPNSANPGYGGPSVGPDYEALGIQPPAGSWTWGNVGYMAKGGPVYRDHPYVVGERGPELYVPKQDGSILPNGAGSIVMNNSFNINGTGQDIARVVSAELTRMMRVGRKWPAV